MMIIKREKLIKKVVGIMIFIMAMITIITNVNTQKIYAYEISPEVNGTVDVQYTLNYEFEEHYKPGESWTCNGKATKTTTFSVPVKVKVTRNTNIETAEEEKKYLEEHPEEADEEEASYLDDDIAYWKEELKSRRKDWKPEKEPNMDEEIELIKKWVKEREDFINE